MLSGDTYKFRQRSGRINWENLSELDIDDVTRNGRLGDLQGILDNVAFSEITLSDIRQQQQEDPSNVLKLVQSMQLMLEYVLQGQEFQAVLVRKMHAKYGPLKKRASRLETENVFLKEDIKVYKRQLAGLRSRLQAGGQNSDLPPDKTQVITESPERNLLQPRSPGAGLGDNSTEQKQGDMNGGAKSEDDIRGLVLDLISLHKGEDHRIEVMQNSLLSAIEGLQLQARGSTQKDSPLRKRVKSEHKSSASSEGDHEGERSLDLSVSSDGGRGISSVVSSPLAYQGKAEGGQEEMEGNLPKKPYTQVMTAAMIASAEETQLDLKTQQELVQAKKEAELASREKEVAEKMAKIHLIEKSILQSQIVMERERLSVAEERFALVPLKAMKQEMADKERANTRVEEERRQEEERKVQEQRVREESERQRQGERNRAIAAKIIKARLATFTWKKLLNRFRKWVAETLNQRDREAFQRQQEAMRKVAKLEVASKHAAHESEEKEAELKERLRREREELESHNRDLEEKRSREKEEDERRHAVLVALETERVRLETERRIEEERRKQEEVDKAMAAAKRRVIDVQTSLDFTVITDKDDEEHRNAKRAIADLHRDLGIDDTREMTDDEVFLKAQQRAGSYGAGLMPSKVDLKQQLEREMRERLESKSAKGDASSPRK